MNFALHLPINAVSFGNCSVAILREIYKRGLQPCLFCIGQPDVSNQKIEPDFGNWLNSCINKSLSIHNRNTPIFKLWHIQDSLESFSNKQILLTFYELDNPTPQELNIIRNNEKVLVTNNYAKTIFEDYGANNIDFVPLGFDAANFHVKNKKYFSDDRIVFNVVGKYEPVRKRHAKIIKSWIKKYGNNPSVFLQCAIYNPFLNQQENEAVIRELLDGRNYFNVQFLGYMQQNELYNDYLNSSQIVIGAGTEGFGLPEMHSVALGKYGVILNAAGYKAWATEENSILIKPSGKIPAYDGRFFVQGRPFSQGNIFDVNEDDIIAGCEKAIEKVKKNPVNTEGLKLQQSHTYEKTVDKILQVVQSIN